MRLRKRLFWVISFLVLFLFVLSCQPSLPGIESLSPEENLTLTNQTEPLGPCLPGWKCIGKWEKAYQYSNCSWTDRIHCPLSCENNTCLAGKTCPSGFKCIDETKMGYQTEACLWLNVQKCDWGCEKGQCLPRPENYTEEVVETTPPPSASEEEPAAEEPPQEELRTLRLGEKETLEVSGTQYNLSLYNLEADQAILKLNDWKSDWLAEGSNFTSSGITITIKEILFQAYPGGAKAVSYTIK